MRTIYISGPMTGIPDHNFPLFNATAANLRASGGFFVLNPAEHFGGAADRQRWEYMHLDFAQVLASDIVLVLPGWGRSVGAVKEVMIARETAREIWQLKGDTIDCTPPDLCAAELALAAAFAPAPVETICQEADRLVSNDRGADYGHPFHDFSRTGRIWGAILGIPDVSPEAVGLCMVGVKLSREVNRPKRDNRADGCGYLKCVDMIHERRQ